MFENRVNILNDDCCNVMRLMKENNIFVDLTVTSPPYDDLRTYNNSSSWDFNKFKEVAKLLYDITAEGGNTWENCDDHRAHRWSSFSFYGKMLRPRLPGLRGFR